VLCSRIAEEDAEEGGKEEVPRAILQIPKEAILQYMFGKGTYIVPLGDAER
jgi:hypothetical protein